MNIAGWCIKNNRTSWTFFALIVIAGIMSYRSLPRLENPDFTVRAALVITMFPGASPTQVESLITDKLESKIQEMAEVIKIESQSLQDVSIISIECDPKYMDMTPIWQKLRNKLQDMSGELPSGVIGPAVNDEFGDVFPVMIAVIGDGYTYRELKEYADDLRNEMLLVPNVAKVEIHGVQAERVFVEFSISRLAKTGISPRQLMAMLSAQNIIRPGGSARVGPDRILIETTGEFHSLDDIQRVAIRLPGQSQTVYLEDIATITRGFEDPPAGMTRYQGREALILAASMTSDGKVTDMGPAVIRKVEAMQRQAPWGIDFIPVFSQEKYVTRSINDFMINLFEAFGFVVVVMLIFTGLRLGLIVGALVPMAMLACMTVMLLLNITLQQVSIAALIIALGMLVDNGVVTGENMLVRIANGEDRLSAAKNTVAELWLPLLTSSLTTICAFLPIAMAKSDVAEYCFSLFQVITITLLSSWLLSITFIPVLCYYLLKPKKQTQSFDNKFYRSYRRILLWSLGHRTVVCGAILTLMVVAGICFKFVPNIFFPPVDREMVTIDFWMPYGTDISETSEELKKLEDMLMARTNEVEHITSFAGAFGPRWYLSLDVEQDYPNYANVIVTLHDSKHIPELEKVTATFLNENLPSCRFSIKRLENGTPVGAPIKIYLSGKEIDTIYALRERIVDKLTDIAGVKNVRDDWGEWTKKVRVEVNQEKAREAGFSSEDVADSLQAQISGLAVTEYREGKNIIPVILRSENAYRQDLGKLESMNIYSYGTGHNVPLLQLAKTEIDWQLSNVRRRNRERTMTIMSDVSGRFASDVLAELTPAIQAMTEENWPDGYKIEFGGEDAESAKAQESIMEVVPLAIGFLTLILVGQFNSFRRPLIIVLTIPPMIIGIVVGLLLTSAPFGFMAFLGMISLLGIIVNNAIMMIDRIEIEKSKGQPLADAIVIAAHRRLRPIIATATTTVMGLLPLSLQGGEMWRPMANTIMFGLAFATVLTLVLCPVLYSIFFRASFKDYTWNPSALDKSRE